MRDCVRRWVAMFWFVLACRERCERCGHAHYSLPRWSHMRAGIGYIVRNRWRCAVCGRKLGPFHRGTIYWTEGTVTVALCEQHREAR